MCNIDGSWFYFSGEKIIGGNVKMDIFRFSVAGNLSEEESNKIADSLVGSVKGVVEEYFMKSGEDMVACWFEKGNYETTFIVYLHPRFYNRHIGCLIEDQCKKELSELGNKITLKIFPEEDRFSWKENYCKNCRRYVEFEEFEFEFNEDGNAVSYVGTCKGCGKVVMKGKMEGEK